MPGDKPNNPTDARPRKFYSLLTMLVVVACVVLPVMFWRGTWFGRRLSDEQLSTYLASADQPRQLQHALTEITERIDKGDGPTKPYHPAITALADHENWQVRNTVAWVMGWDHDGEGFHDALLSLLRDPILVVRQNAALALVNFDDDTGKAIILAMLKSTPVISPSDGAARDLVPIDAPVRADLVIGHIDRENDRSIDLKAPISGRIGRHFIQDGETVTKGEPVIEIMPGEAQIAQALQALAFIGDASDLAAIAEAKNANTATPAIMAQAKAAEQQIRRRTGGA